MTISDADRLSILELRQRGLSVREIATEIGVSKNTVSNVLSSGAVPKTVPKTEPSSRARATKRVSQKSPEKLGQCPKKIGTVAEVQVISPRTITRDLTITELFNLLGEAKATLERAKEPDENGDHDVKAEVAAINSIKAILTQMGEWCGLDDSIKTVDVRPDKPPDQYTLDEALRLAEDLCRQ